MKTEIFVAAPGKIRARLPKECVPVIAGSALKKKDDIPAGFLRDDTGDNISLKNPNYSELSVLYHAWKHSDADIRGLCHYRRYFGKMERIPLLTQTFTFGKDLPSQSLPEGRAAELLKTHDIILLLPYPPYPLNGGEDLVRFVYQKDIDHLTDVLRETYPAYMDSYEAVLAMHNLSYCNMMIAGRSVFDDYCKWVFDVLARVEERCDLTGYDTQHARIYGYLSEVLLNVWVRRQKLKVQYLNQVVLLDYWQVEDRIARSMSRYSHFCDRLTGTPLFPAYEAFFAKRHPDDHAKYRSCLEAVGKRT